jgi:hypothetical protein
VSALPTPNADSISEFLEDLTPTEMGLSIRTLGQSRALLSSSMLWVSLPWEEQKDEAEEEVWLS